MLVEGSGRATSSVASTNNAQAGTKKYPPLFLIVFTVFLISTIACVGGALAGILSAQPAHHDTLWFWASGHLLVHHGNPYDREAIRQIETALDSRPQISVPVTLNPPYTLFLMAPIGLLGPRAGLIAWSLLLAVCLIISVRAVQAMVDPPYDHRYLLLAWCFAPTICCIEVGQTGLIVLLGLTLFLRFNEDRPFWAGAFLSLCAVKPHLLLPFGAVLPAWILVRRRWSIVLGVAAAVAVETLIAMLFDHAIWSHYRALIRTEPFAVEFIPTLGVALRFLVDRTAMWLEFVPAALGSVWGLWYFWRNRERWDWRTHGSVLTLVSLIAAPYAWLTDQVVALPAILFALLSAGGPRKGSLTLLMAIMSITTVEMLMTSSLFFKPNMLLAVVYLGWYLYATSDAVPVEESVVTG